MNAVELQNLDQYLSTLNITKITESNDDGNTTERYSRKVFVSGLPEDINEFYIKKSFARFGSFEIDWPYKMITNSFYSPKGHAYLIFENENSVRELVDKCINYDGKLYLWVSSLFVKDKMVQIRPWRLHDGQFIANTSTVLDPRKTIFVDGVPRPLKAVDLAKIINRIYGEVSYAGIGIDDELNYPKGNGFVAFSSYQNYMAALSDRLMHLNFNNIETCIEMKPVVFKTQLCWECERKGYDDFRLASFYCPNVKCFRYYCLHCWALIHSVPGYLYHVPLVKEGVDQPNAIPYHWLE